MYKKIEKYQRKKEDDNLYSFFIILRWLFKKKLGLKNYVTF